MEIIGSKSGGFSSGNGDFQILKIPQKSVE